MSDIDVEAVEDATEGGRGAPADDRDPADGVAEEGTVASTGLDAPEYVLYGGKGGVGKTTCAAATALRSAREGVRTLVVSTDPAHSLSDAFETDVPAEPAPIREDVPLYGVEIDPAEALDDGPLGTGGDLGGLGSMLEGATGGFGAAAAGPGAGGAGTAGTGAGGPGDAAAGGFDTDSTHESGPAGEADPFGGDEPLAEALPGADEAAALRLLLRYMDDDRFERVVVDTAPTGHTLRLLELPETMDSTLGTIVQLKERLSGLFDGLGGLFGGGEEPEAPSEADLDAVRDRIERLRTALRDPARTDFRVVLVPEELSVLEAERLLDRLEEFGIPVGTVVVNRVLQHLADVLPGGEDAVTALGVDQAVGGHEAAGPDEAAGPGAAGGLVGPDLDDCAFCARRWDVQQTAIQRAQDVFRGHDVRRVPLLATEVRGEALLSVVAACIEGPRDEHPAEA